MAVSIAEWIVKDSNSIFFINYNEEDFSRFLQNGKKAARSNSSSRAPLSGMAANQFTVEGELEKIFLQREIQTP